MVDPIPFYVHQDFFAEINRFLKYIVSTGTIPLRARSLFATLRYRPQPVYDVVVGLRIIYRIKNNSGIFFSFRVFFRLHCTAKNWKHIYPARWWILRSTFSPFPRFSRLSKSFDLLILHVAIRFRNIYFVPMSSPPGTCPRECRCIVYIQRWWGKKKRKAIE